MKKLLIALLVVSTAAYASLSKTEKRTIEMSIGGAASKVQLGEHLFHGTKQVAYAAYDFGVKGGSTGVKFLGVNIPDKAIIQQVHYVELTNMTVIGAPLFSIGASVPADLVASTAVTGVPAGVPVAGTQTGAIGTWLSIGASTVQEGYPLQLIVTDSAGDGILSPSATEFIRAGKIAVWVEYVVAE